MRMVYLVLLRQEVAFGVTNPLGWDSPIINTRSPLLKQLINEGYVEPHHVAVFL